MDTECLYRFQSHGIRRVALAAPQMVLLAVSMKLSLSFSLFAGVRATCFLILGLTRRCTTLYNVPCVGVLRAFSGAFHSFHSDSDTPRRYLHWEVPSHRYSLTHTRTHTHTHIEASSLCSRRFASFFRISDCRCRSRIFIFSQSPWAGATVKMCGACRLWKPWLFSIHIYIYMYFLFFVSHFA